MNTILVLLTFGTSPLPPQAPCLPQAPPVVQSYYHEPTPKTKAARYAPEVIYVDRWGRRIGVQTFPVNPARPTTERSIPQRSLRSGNC